MAKEFLFDRDENAAAPRYCDGIAFAFFISPNRIASRPLIAMLTTIECKFSELHQSVLPMLRGRVFHLAEAAAADAFRRRGFIEAQHHGQFGSALCPPQKSYGAKRGYVCLFDFRSQGKTDLEEAFILHYFLKPFHYGNAYAYLFLAAGAWTKLIPWKQASSEIGTKELYIPFVEAWYPGDLPFELISDCLIVTVQPTAGVLREIIAKSQPNAAP
jgi:hypothetical protein